jgi:pyruvate kinase
MLSGETAAGAYPVQAVEMMHRIVLRAEAAGRQAPTDQRRRDQHRVSHARAISHAARSLAEDLKVAAVVAFTQSGRTAHLMSQDRPRAPIYAFTPSQTVYRRLALWWGVIPMIGDLPEHTEALVQKMEEKLLDCGAISRGDLLVVTGAMPFRVGLHTNFVKLHTAVPDRT